MRISRRLTGMATLGFGLLLVLLLVWKRPEAEAEVPEEPTFSQQQAAISEQEKYEKHPDLEISTEENQNEDGFRVVRGTIRSKSQKQYSYIELNLGTYDRSGRLLKPVTVTVMPQPEQKELTFEATADDLNATRFDLLRSTAW